LRPSVNGFLGLEVDDDAVASFQAIAALDKRLA
jgi:hypothetical protein